MITENTESPLIEWNGIARRYAGPAPVDALRATDLTIASGDYVAVVGPSGSGKSTLLNVLGLLDRPTSGTYRLLGMDVGSLSETQRTAVRAQAFGFVFQAFHLLAGRTVAENVELGMLYGPHVRSVRRARAAEVVEQVGLSPRRTAVPQTLSGGERQRVAIARALAARPRILLCDEPTGNLDSRSAAQILALIDDVHSGGTAVVIVTHDPNMAARARRTIEVMDGVVRC